LKRPGFLTTAWILWRLRVSAWRNRRRMGQTTLGTVLMVLAIAALTIAALFVASLVSFAMIVLWRADGNGTWVLFAMNLLYLVAMIVMLTWPVLSAAVDESFELDRYQRYPVPLWRLYVLHAFTGLSEPLTLFLFPILWLPAVACLPAERTGALLGRQALLVEAFLFGCVALSRLLLNILLNFLKGRRTQGGVALGLFVVLAITLAMPPVDAGWLFNAGGLAGALSAENLQKIHQANVGMERTLPGQVVLFLIDQAREGRLKPQATLWLLFLSAIWLALGVFLIDRFYRGWGWLSRLRRRREEPARLPAASLRDGFDSTRGVGGPFTALYWRELRYFARNPRAQLLFFIPFFLLSASRLFQAHLTLGLLVSKEAALLLPVVIGLTAVAVMATNLLVNLFAYDGTGIWLLRLAPVPPRRVVLAKFAACGSVVGVQLAVLLVLSGVYFEIPAATLALAVLPVAAAFGAALVVGRRLSVIFYRPFTMELTRRDRPPFLAALGGLAAIAVAAAPASRLYLAAADGSAVAAIGAAAIAVVALMLGIGTADADLAALAEKV
jgi:hypothetical protein